MRCDVKLLDKMKKHFMTPVVLSAALMLSSAGAAVVSAEETSMENETAVENEASIGEAASETVTETDDNVVNILLIGQDSRDPNTNERSDSMILATLNKDENQISLTSFMRDLYVEIPGYGGNRMNAAYSLGGMELLDEVLEVNFGVKVDGNVEVDFSSFQELIDLLGGVEIDLSQDEADFICGRNQNVLHPQPYREDWLYLTAGINNLNGEQALVHARNRSIGNSDYERTDRQREVIMSCFDKVMNTNKFKLIPMVDDVFDMIETDISYKDLLGYGLSVLEMDVESIESYRIPQDGAYHDDTINGMMVLVPDLELCKEYLDEIL